MGWVRWRGQWGGGWARPATDVISSVSFLSSVAGRTVERSFPSFFRCLLSLYFCPAVNGGKDMGKPY